MCRGIQMIFHMTPMRGTFIQHCVALAQLLVEQNFTAISTHTAMAEGERLNPLNSGFTHKPYPSNHIGQVIMLFNLKVNLEKYDKGLSHKVVNDKPDGGKAEQMFLCSRRD